MKITQDNYEQYFLDHAEGTLSPEMEKELSDFLEANPDLKTWFSKNSILLPYRRLKFIMRILKARAEETFTSYRSHQGG